MRKTMYGTLTNEKELDENEKAILYIKETAESVGINVEYGKTAFDMLFMAEIMRRLRENKKETPSVTPSTGTWIETDDDDEIFGQVYKCSICGLLEVCGNDDDYCPKCGSKMNV